MQTRSASARHLLQPAHGAPEGLPTPNRPLQKIFTGLGTVVPSFQRATGDAASSSDLFSTQLTMGTPTSGNGDDLKPPATAEAALRRVRRARQRAERLPRPEHKRGAHAHEESLMATVLPHPQQGCPPKMAKAAEAFDRRHRRRWDQAEQLCHALSRDVNHAAKHSAFEAATWEIRLNRFYTVDDLVGVPRYATRQKKPPPRRAWRLEDSIWAPRPKLSESNGFWDSPDCKRKALETCWKRALDCGLGRYVLRMNGSDDKAEVDDVFAVLWEFHDLVFALFDFYSALGASNDITHMQQNAFATFLFDCGLALRVKQHATLFNIVDASSAGGKTDERYNRRHALNLQEFVQALVQAAGTMYVESGARVDTSDALHHMFSTDIEPRLDQKVFCEPNEFRSAHAYTEEVDTVLRQFESSLRLVYERASLPAARNMDLPGECARPTDHSAGQRVATCQPASADPPRASTWQCRGTLRLSLPLRRS